MNEYVNKCVNTHHMMTFACEGNIIIHRVYSMRRITYVHSGGMLKKKMLVTVSYRIFREQGLERENKREKRYDKKMLLSLMIIHR